jgi:hypothetical protein
VELGNKMVLEPLVGGFSNRRNGGTNPVFPAAKPNLFS